jgi:hypothetical protein
LFTSYCIVDFEEIKTPGSYLKICCSTSQRNSTLYGFPQQEAYALNHILKLLVMWCN